MIARRLRLAALVLALGKLMTVQGAITTTVNATVVDDRALADENDGRNWAGNGRTFSEQRHSPLAQIDARGIQHLGLLWSLELEAPGNVATAPLEVDGVIYFGVGLGQNDESAMFFYLGRTF